MPAVQVIGVVDMAQMEQESAATQIAGNGLPLGILPLGISNDTARALGIPLRLDAACAVVAQGVPTPIAVGQVVPLWSIGNLISAGSCT